MPGEIAEMMLDGALCEGCGEWLGDDGPQGFPGYCSDYCAGSRSAFRCEPAAPKPVQCPQCTRRFAGPDSLKQHLRDRHKITEKPAP